MKPIRLSKKFDKAYLKLIRSSPEFRTNYIRRVLFFKSGERGYPLNDHALGGKLSGKRVFSITSDIRVVYEETEKEIIFLDIGTHNQVYK
ncbi:type II toxin-antitoxin system mRNA interferase toxin, RelE/StbE family [Candidatus Saccharibacteria bacterium]|nr:type II toxin-antitoxin system mRNA interferase toxin, RelE/StbE family [Candidatus Saccharibacteria bacterium]